MFTTRAVALIAIGSLLASACKDEVAVDEPVAEAPVEASAEEALKAEPMEQKGARPFEATGAIATVAGKPVPADAFNAEVDRMVKMTQGRPLPGPMVEMYRKQILDKVVNDVLIENEIAKQKIAVSDAEVDTEWTKVTASAPSPAEYQKFLEKIGMTEQDVREEMRMQLGTEQLLEKRYGAMVSEADVAAFYKENEKRYEQDAQVKASHVLIKVDPSADEAKKQDALKRAKEVAKKAKADPSKFAELAREYSEGPTAPKGGDLGFFAKDKMVKPFADAAFKMKKGEVSDPVESRFGYHVIMVTDTKKAGKASLAEVKEEIEERLKRQKMRQSLEKLVNELKAEQQVALNESAIKVNVDTSAPAAGMPGMGGLPPGHPPTGGAHGHGPNDGHDHGKPMPKIEVKPATPGAPAAK